MDNLTDYLNKRPKLPVTLVFTNKPYLPIFDIWHALYLLNPGPDLIVVALDRTSHENLMQRGIRCFYVGSGEFEDFLSLKIYDDHERSIHAKLWLLRAMTIKMILDSGADIISSDCDAFWLRNVYDVFAKADFDITFSIAFAHPEDIVRHWGFILCMGLFLIKYNQKTVKFFSDFMHELSCIYNPDDQAVINRLLYEENVSWKRSRIRNYKTYMQKYDIRIQVLGDHLVSRKRTSHGIYAFHPFLKGDIDRKVADSLTGIRKIMGKSGRLIPCHVPGASAR